MLTVRMQRTGRKGQAHYRVVVQDSRKSPLSGKNVASLGHFNPHNKEHGVDLEKAKTFIDNGAQPSARVAKFLKDNGVKLPKWVVFDDKKTAKIKNQDKLRRNRPAEEAPADDAEQSTDSESTEKAETKDSHAPKKEEDPQDPKAEESTSQDEKVQQEPDINQKEAEATEKQDLSKDETASQDENNRVKEDSDTKS